MVNNRATSISGHGELPQMKPLPEHAERSTPCSSDAIRSFPRVPVSRLELVSKTCKPS
jgi:hypothetical protein